MRLSLILAAVAGAATFTAGLAIAQEGESPEALAVEMRQGHMLQYRANIGVLGAMAQGNLEYDAAAAQTAADNLVHLASVQWGYMWIPGTAKGEIEGSNALPAIWEKMDDFEAKHQGLLTAATAMQAAAGTDLDSLKGAMAGLGGACGSCHEAYRASE